MRPPNTLSPLFNHDRQEDGQHHGLTVAYLAMGIGNGAVYAALGLALVMTYKSSGVVNFATGAIALYAAYNYAYLRQGKLFNPIPGLDAKIDLGTKLGIFPALVLAVLIATVLGILLYLIVFRPMRTAPALAKAVAAIGIMLVLQALIALRVKDDSPPVRYIFPRAVSPSAANASPPITSGWRRS